jgi:hypothetical protein
MKKELQKPAATSGESHERIAQLAYLYYQQNGREEGHDLENWLRAECELTGGRSTAEPSRQEAAVQT